MKQMGEGLKNAISDRVRLATVLKGIIIAYIVTIPAFIIFAFLLTYTNVPQKYISTVVVVVTMLSLLTAGIVSTRKLKSKGWLNGGIVGLIYMVLLYILKSFVFKDYVMDGHILVMFVIGLLTGSIGGIVGINFRVSSKLKYKAVRR